jgi:hypothetical protein
VDCIRKRSQNRAFSPPIINIVWSFLELGTQCHAWASEDLKLESGKLADLLILDADPLKYIGTTERIAGVLSDGCYLDRQKLDQLLTEASKLASNRPR